MGLCTQEAFKGTTLLKVGLAPSVKIMGWVGEVGGRGGVWGLGGPNRGFCLLHSLLILLSILSPACASNS